LLNLRSTVTLLDAIRIALDRFGYTIAFCAAFIEAIPAVNLYFPGSVVIVVAVSYSRSGSLDPFIVIVLITLAFVICYSLNFYLGRLGLHGVLVRFGLGPSINKSREHISSHGLGWLMLASWHPNCCAIASIACGILSVPYHRFLSYMVPAVVVWNTLFGAAAYFGSKYIMRLLELRWFLFIVGIWLIWLVVRGFKSSRHAHL
jgi:membrane protein DedA with SNARE-associated domain